LNALEPADDFEPDALASHLEETQFVEILYDDLFQQFAARMLQQSEQLITGLRSAGLGRLATLFTTDAQEANFVRDNIFDVLIYRAMREHRLMTRKHVALQIANVLRAHIGEDVEYSIIAHSLGTAVMHDALQEMATESGSPFQFGLFSFANLVMIANTSAVLRNDFDPRESFIRPFVRPMDPGYVTRYWNISHKFDPVAQIGSYERFMKGQSLKRFTFTTIEHFQSASIHSIIHYLNDPAVHIRLFQAVYGDRLVPETYVAAISTLRPGMSLATAAIDELKTRLAAAFLPPAVPAPADRSMDFITLAKLLPEVV
jgi:hypothetical protein